MKYEEKLLKELKISAKIYNQTINNIKINYLVAGKGEPLILLHGAGIGWGQWYKNIPYLSKYFKVYAIDLPGAGGSTKVDYKKLKFEKEVIEILDQFIKKLNLHNPHVVGHSIGAWIALKLAGMKGNSKFKLILSNPLGLTDKMPLQQFPLAIPSIADFISKTVMKPTKSNIESFLKDPLQRKNVVSKEFVEYVHEGINREKLNHPLILISRIAGIPKVKREFIFIEEFKKMKNKILVIAGEYDPIVNFKQLKKNVHLNTRAKIKVFSGVGHVPSIELPDLFNKTVKDFLTE